jgi:hypothetical protein
VIGGLDCCGCAEGVGDFSTDVALGMEIGGGIEDCSATQSDVLSECLCVSIAGGGPFQESLNPFRLWEAGTPFLGFANNVGAVVGWDEAEGKSSWKAGVAKPGNVRGRAKGRDDREGDAVAESE